MFVNRDISRTNNNGDQFISDQKMNPTSWIEDRRHIQDAASCNKAAEEDNIQLMSRSHKFAMPLDPEENLSMANYSSTIPLSYQKSALRFGSLKPKKMVKKIKKSADSDEIDSEAETPSVEKEYTLTSELAFTDDRQQYSEMDRFHTRQAAVNNYRSIVDAINQDMNKSNLRFAEKWVKYRDNNFTKY